MTTWPGSRGSGRGSPTGPPAFRGQSPGASSPGSLCLRAEPELVTSSGQKVSDTSRGPGHSGLAAGL